MIVKHGKMAFVPVSIRHDRDSGTKYGLDTSIGTRIRLDL